MGKKTKKPRGRNDISLYLTNAEMEEVRAAVCKAWPALNGAPNPTIITVILLYVADQLKAQAKNAK